MSNTWIGRRRNKARVFPGFTGFLSRLLVQRCGSEGARNRTFTARPSQSHGARTQLRPRAGAPRKTPRLTEGRPRGAAVFSARPCPAGAPPRRAGGRAGCGEMAVRELPLLLRGCRARRRRRRPGGGERAGLHPQKQAGGCGGFFRPTPCPAAMPGSKKRLGQGSCSSPCASSFSVHAELSKGG